MTFEAQETGIATGQPVILFDFSIGPTHWRYTTTDRPITWNGNMFLPEAISRTAPTQSSDIRQQTMRVTTPRDIAIAALYQVYPPASDMLLTCIVLHYNDSAQQGIADWVGRVLSPVWKDSTIEWSCEPVYTSIQTLGLRRRWGLSCPHVLYGPACTLSAAAFGVTADVSSVSGTAVTMPSGFVPGSGLSFAGGYVSWTSPLGYPQYRDILSFDGTVLTLNYGSPELIAGLSLTAYPGCQRTMSNCTSFGNLANFGGDPFMPNKNPMDGTLDPIY